MKEEIMKILNNPGWNNEYKCEMIERIISLERHRGETYGINKLHKNMSYAKSNL